MSTILNRFMKLTRLDVSIRDAHNILQMKPTYQNKLRYAQSYAAKVTKSSVKRITNKSTDLIDDGRWSIIAYNLSDELEIDKSQKLLEKLDEYEMNVIPKDLENEAVMLSLKSKDNRSERSLHDIFIFREGSIVFWGVPYDQQKRILYGLSPLKIDPNSSELIQDEREHLEYRLVENDGACRLTRDIVQVAYSKDKDSLYLDQFAISHAVALSVKLGIWEVLLDQYIDSIAWVTDSMKSGKDIHLTRGDVFRKTGEIYELKHNLILSSDLLDLPDVYWDRHEQEVLFLSVQSFLNIRKRTAVMTEKLNNCVELMALLSTHMSDKHHVRLEWMIIVLILVEVLFELSRFL